MIEQFTFSDVAVKADGTYVVTIDGLRSHVTADYNAPLFEAVGEYLAEGGDFTDYAEDVFVDVDPQVAAQIWIEQQLLASDKVVSEYRDARDLDEPTVVTPAQFSELLGWRQAVRAWPKTVDYPALASRPVVPDWLDVVIADGE